MSYQQYLRSEEWKRIRRTVLRRDKYRCRSCGRTARQVHHGSYSTAVKLGQDLSQLFSLCGGCHLIATFRVSGSRRSKEEVLEMAAALNRPEPKAQKIRSTKAHKPKTRRAKLTIEGIRALSQQYAEGRMR